jgi:hypothetical protein
MPKELIVGEHPYLGEDGPEDARSVVEVRWHGESGYFQIATRCVRDSNRDVGYVPPYVAKVIADGGGVTTSDNVQYTPGSPEPLPTVVHVAADGFYVTLERSGINDLIRVLRRARDQAYGRDE